MTLNTKPHSNPSVNKKLLNTVSLLALLKLPMNFEPVLKGAVAVVSFLNPWATAFWEAWGVLGTNLVPGAHDPWSASRPKSKHHGGDGGIERILLRCCKSPSELL